MALSFSAAQPSGKENISCRIGHSDSSASCKNGFKTTCQLALQMHTFNLRSGAFSTVGKGKSTTLPS